MDCIIKAINWNRNLNCIPFGSCRNWEEWKIELLQMSTSSLSVLHLRNVFVICFSTLWNKTRKRGFHCLGEPEIDSGQAKLDFFFFPCRIALECVLIRKAVFQGVCVKIITDLAQVSVMLRFSKAQFSRLTIINWKYLFFLAGSDVDISF